MKVAGCRAFIVCLAIVALLAGPVYANPINLIPPDFMAHVFIEKDGTPYTGNITYTMNCYGHTTKQIYKSPAYLRNKTKDDPDPPQLVFYLPTRWTSHFTEMCDFCHYGYYYLDPDHSELCQLNGSTEKGEFSVWNVSDKPAVNYSRREEWPHNFYDFYFTLPSDIPTPEVTASPTEVLFVPNSPVESLYCSILSLFGARC